MKPSIYSGKPKVISLKWRQTLLHGSYVAQTKKLLMLKNKPMIMLKNGPKLLAWNNGLRLTIISNRNYYSYFPPLDSLLVAIFFFTLTLDNCIERMVKWWWLEILLLMMSSPFFYLQNTRIYNLHPLKMTNGEDQFHFNLISHCCLGPSQLYSSFSSFSFSHD